MRGTVVATREIHESSLHLAKSRCGLSAQLKIFQSSVENLSEATERRHQSGSALAKNTVPKISYEQHSTARLTREDGVTCFLEKKNRSGRANLSIRFVFRRKCSAMRMVRVSTGAFVCFWSFSSADERASLLQCPKHTAIPLLPSWQHQPVHQEPEASDLEE